MDEATDEHGETTRPDSPGNVNSIGHTEVGGGKGKGRADSQASDSDGNDDLDSSDDGDEAISTGVVDQLAGDTCSQCSE